MRFLESCKSWLAAFGHHKRGNVTLIFALSAPAIVMISVGVMELGKVQSNRGRLQDIADTAALAGANELGLAVNDSVAIERAKVFVQGQVSEWNGAPDVTSEVTVLQQQGQRVLQVILKGSSPSFFVDLLPPGGWKYRGEARAISVGLTPLCVLITGASGTKLLNVKDTSRLSAPQCLVHSNRDILVEGGSITANQVEAVTSAKGVISPTAGTGAALIDDPFKTLSIIPPKLCSSNGFKATTGSVRLAPGVHCGEISLGGNAELTLDAGEHWFVNGKVAMTGKARLMGTDVVLFFDKGSKFEFEGNSEISLDGRKRGTYAGMVMIAARGNTEDFLMSSDHVTNLLGVIYVPDAQLIVQGKGGNIAKDSDWTVIVARSLQLSGAPSLVINANYAGSEVPVPVGVGPRDGGIRLVN